MKKFLGIASAAALLAATAFATPTAAADLPPAPEPIPIAAPDWTGFYVGGHAGYGWGKMKDALNCEGDPFWVFVSEPGSPATGNCEDADLGGSLETNEHLGGIYYFQKEDPKGWLAGLQLGYNYQMGNWVLGAEVSGSVSSISSTRHADICLLGAGCIGAVSGRYDVNFLVTAVGKVGWAMDRWLLTAEGGLALVNTSNTNTLGFDDDSVTTAGWTVGTGLEFKITDTITTFGKYNYIRADGVEHLGTNLLIFPTIYKSDLELHVVKIGFNKIFN
jgi:outer membrane immunogenic protein